MKGNNGHAARTRLMKRLTIVLASFLACLVLISSLTRNNRGNVAESSSSSSFYKKKSLLRQRRKYSSSSSAPQIVELDSIDDADPSVLQDILNANLHLINLQRQESTTNNNNNPMASITAEFCTLNFFPHKQDPSSVPMFRDLVNRSDEGCGKVRYRIGRFDTLVERIRQHDNNNTTLLVKSLSLKGVVFHESRCGSTLVANSIMAADRDKHRVYSESAPPIMAIKSICGDENYHHQSCTKSQAATILQSTFYVMGRSNDMSETSVFYKIQSIGTRNIEVFQEAFPNTPWIFVYREPVQVMMSHLSKGSSMKNANCVRPRKFPPDIVVDLVQRQHKTIRDLSDEEYCAAHLATITESAVRAMTKSKGLGMAVNYEDLPRILYESVLPNHFHVEVTDDMRENIEEVSQKYSKGRDGQQREWQQDSERKEELATLEIRKAAMLFLQESYEQLLGTRNEEETFEEEEEEEDEESEESETNGHKDSSV